jgi:hypothetical protein
MEINFIETYLIVMILILNQSNYPSYLSNLQEQKPKFDLDAQYDKQDGFLK